MTNNFKAVIINGIAISLSLTAMVRNSLRRKKKADQLLADFYGVAAEFNFNITKQQMLGTQIIGFDDSSNRLLFFTAAGDKREGYLIEMDNIKSSTVKRAYAFTKRNNGYGADATSYVDKIELQLNYKSGALPLTLPFYDKAADSIFEMPERTRKASEWQRLVSKHLTKEAVVVKRSKRSLENNYRLN